MLAFSWHLLVVSALATPLPADAGAAIPLDRCPAGLAGAWTGSLDVPRLFGLRLEVEELAEGDFRAHLSWNGRDEELSVWMHDGRARFQSTVRDVAFAVRKPEDERELDVFVHFAGHISHLRLPRRSDGVWAAQWNYLGSVHHPARLDLYIEDAGDGGTAGYFFFRDPRLPSLFGEGVTCEGDTIQMRERNLGMRFRGRVAAAGDSLHLIVSALSGEVPISFHRIAESQIPDVPDASVKPARAADSATYVPRAPTAEGDGWSTAGPSEAGLDTDVLASLVRAVVEGELTATHAVLVARHGRLVVEEYFYGYGRQTPHDLRSASKTFASALIGLAIRDGVLEGESSTVLELLPYRAYDNWDPRKARITLQDLMTMSSGLDANEYDDGSPASEVAYQSRSHADWVKTALDAPMIDDPGAQPLYGSANPLILGGVLEAALDEPLEWFADDELFGPLDIHDYRWFTVPATGSPYLGGGMYLRPRDMLKIGQVYLDGGMWNGERILPESWVRDSWGRYGRLAPLDVNGHWYGYLWWHHQYEVGGETVETVEARGYGGQYLFVVPEHDLVAVVTAGNYRNGRTGQSEDVMRRFILPALK